VSPLLLLRALVPALPSRCLRPAGGWTRRAAATRQPTTQSRGAEKEGQEAEGGGKGQMLRMDNVSAARIPLRQRPPPLLARLREIASSPAARWSERERSGGQACCQTA
jgi:hypothetical protein